MKERTIERSDWFGFMWLEGVEVTELQRRKNGSVRRISLEEKEITMMIRREIRFLNVLDVG